MPALPVADRRLRRSAGSLADPPNPQSTPERAGDEIEDVHHLGEVDPRDAPGLRRRVRIDEPDQRQEQEHHADREDDLIGDPLLGAKPRVTRARHR